MFIDSKQNKWRISEREHGSMFLYLEHSDGGRVTVYDNANPAQKLRPIDRITKLGSLGILFAGLGVFGYLTMAHELAHTGELVGVTIIFAGGLIMLVMSWLRSRKL